MANGCVHFLYNSSWKFHQLPAALIKNKIKFSSYIRKFILEQLQSHIWLTASSYMGKYLRISSYIRKPFLIYTLQLLHSKFHCIWGKFDFLFYQCGHWAAPVRATGAVPEKEGGIRPVHHVQNHTFVSVVSVLYRNREFRCFDWTETNRRPTETVW
jgi:hypothetical protein